MSANQTPTIIPAHAVAHGRQALALARDVAALGRHVSSDFTTLDPVTLPPGELAALRADFDRAMAAAPFTHLDRARAL